MIVNLSKQPKKSACGFDRNKRKKGSKRQIAVDSQGWILRVLVHPANEQDSVGGKYLLKRLPFWQRLRLFLFDTGYNSPSFLHWLIQVFGVEAQVSQRSKEQQDGFIVQAKRWIVERTFGWLNRFRRLSKDYEQSPAVSESFIYLSMIHLMLRRLTRNS